MKTMARVPPGPDFSHIPSKPATGPARATVVAVDSAWKEEADTSMAGPTVGSSDSWSMAFTTVTATSSDCVTAVGDQPPGGSTAATHGGATSTRSSVDPEGSRSTAV